MASDTESQRKKARQRLARAIEHTYPRELTAFIDYIAGTASVSRYELQKRALEFARIHYNAGQQK